jgi:SAM-dependent MidA family methyltransferase
MIETSEFLRRKQCFNLCNKDESPKTFETNKYKEENSINITWLDDISQLPKSESIHYFLANEFFDAMPIHKFQVILFLL